MRSRTSSRGHVILGRCMNLGIVLNLELESEIRRVRGVARLYVWKARSTELADKVDREQIVRFS